jgi:2'-5' RNA ligase
LWLLPEGSVAEALGELIRSLALAFDTPPFAPHVTLVAGVARPPDEVAREAERLLTDDVEVVKVALGSPEGRPEPFRCISLPVRPSFRILHTEALFRATFAPGDERTYEPHLSLLYGHLDETARSRAVADAASRTPPQVTLVTLEVVRTEGAVEDWRSVARFALPRPIASREKHEA